MAPAALAATSAAAASQPPEIQFAQRLAANEKRIRDRALKKLRGYITLRTQSPSGSFSQEELLKIWKGLFYCMWMQDKPLLQEELSNNISQLIHVIENMDARHLFIETFWQTMSREWNGIDRLRLDKFYTLIRMMLKQSFEVLKRNGWNESFTEPFLNMLMKTVMHPDSNAPAGIKLHFIDIYLEELAKVGATELTAEQNLQFVEPFCKIVSKTKDHLELQAIIHGIFETILDQSPFAIEDIMKEIGADSDDDLSEKDECSDEENALKAKAKNSLRKEVWDTYLYKAVKTLSYQQSQKLFQDLAEGTFPQDDFPEDVSTDEDDDTFSRKKWKRKSGKPFDESKLGKKEKTIDRKNTTEEEDDSTESQKKRKKRKRKASQIANSYTAAGSKQNGSVNLEESREPNQDSESPSNKKRQKKSSSLENNESGFSAASIGGLADNSSLNTLACLVNNVKKQPKKKNGNLQKVSIETVHQNGHAISPEEAPGDCTTVVQDSKTVKKKRKSEPRIITGSVFSEDHVKQPEKDNLVKSEHTVLQKVKLKKKQKLRNLVTFRYFKQKTGLKRQRKIREVLHSTQENEVESENKKNKNKETGDPVVLQKKRIAKAGNEFVKFEKTTPPKPAFFRKAKGSITPVQKTDKSILVSPEGPSRVAFNPEQKPPHGVLKSSSAETPQIKKPILMAAKKRPTAMDFF
ncbi:hypothetical protein JD844_032606 [Phrynosoma platyrhinos]|uniref:Ribosomal RNA processing 1B n=1 Tax=Phrynosoma platyrhinos TaxID=52577 RepID=A0ABQ7T5D4_PHRPL|nr:hypothetical protein JD844_032606 [Phrynosoma platyrhinos]